MQLVKLFNRIPAILLLILLNIIFFLPGMDWLNRGLASFEQNEMYGDFGELKEEEVEELRSERTIKSGLKVCILFNKLFSQSNVVVSMTFFLRFAVRRRNSTLNFG